MKKILIATSALAFVSSASVLALDLKTTGTVDYRYVSGGKTDDGTKKNAKLTRKKAELKFAASGASNGLAYGAYIKVKDKDGKPAKPAVALTKTVLTGAAADLKSHVSGYTSTGLATVVLSKDGKNDDSLVMLEGSPAKEAVAAVAIESAVWVSGAFGKVLVGQDGSAADDNAVDGIVKAADFETGTFAAEAEYDQKNGERITYTAPEFISGLVLAYTTSFKGNTSNDKGAKAAKSWAVAYSTTVAGMGIKVAHVSGTTKTDGKEVSKEFKETDYVPHTVKKTNKATTSTGTGVEFSYGGFTVGYGVFKNSKKYDQTKGKGAKGKNYGVKYANGSWAVAYTVKKSEDKNVYVDTDTAVKSASTTAISASYQVAQGFSVYASQAKNKATHLDNKGESNTYTIIGAKISF